MRYAGLRKQERHEDHLARAGSEGYGITESGTLYQPSTFVSAIVTVPH